MRTRIPIRAALLAVACLAGACAAAPPPTLYLLPEPPPAASPGTGLRGTVVALAAIALPDYAGATRIATLSATGAAHQSDQALWADSLGRAASSALARALAARSGATVLAEPWPIDLQPDLRVEVIADRLIGGLGGRLRFTGEYRISGTRSGHGLTVRDFAIETPVPGPGYADLAAAHAAALALLADDIAAALAAAAAS